MPFEELSCCLHDLVPFTSALRTLPRWMAADVARPELKFVVFVSFHANKRRPTYCIETQLLWRHYRQSVLSLSSHAAALCRSGFYHLRQPPRPLCRPLPAEATKTLVQTFILCRLDYCNSLLYGVTDKLMRQVKSVQNAAARLITGAKRREHITPILCQLHSLPVRRRVEFKMASLVYQVLSSKVPVYLADDIHLASESSARSLRSSSGRKCSVTRVYSRFGDMFCCSWTTYLEHLTCQSVRQGSQLHRIQKASANIHVSDGLRRIVTFLLLRLLSTLTYLQFYDFKEINAILDCEKGMSVVVSGVANVDDVSCLIRQSCVASHGNQNIGYQTLRKRLCVSWSRVWSTLSLVVLMFV